MPNDVRNIVKMEGITELPLFSTNEYKEKYIDFNKIIPMPDSLNIVSGTELREATVYYLTERCTMSIDSLTSGAKTVLRTISNGHGYSYKELTQDAFNKALDNYRKRSEEDKKDFYQLGKKYVENVTRYGTPTWYEWRTKYWGTKWNSYDNKKVDKDTISFSTAWNEPEPIIKKLAEMYPDRTIKHIWADGDMGCNTGYKEYNGDSAVGGYFTNGSNEAYENYIRCWGESNCLERDEDGNWQHKDCGLCHEC